MKPRTVFAGFIAPALLLLYSRAFATSPTISHSPTSMIFSGQPGGANPSSKTLSIWNSGTGTLNWSVSGDASWLLLSPTSGSSTGQVNSVTVSVNTTGLSAGTYNATITISAPGATNTPQTVSVTLALYTSTTILNNGPSAEKVDIVFLGDGYTSSQMTQYATDVQAFTDYFFNQKPFSEYKNFFNVHRVDVISNQSGTDNPNCDGTEVDTALDTKFYPTGNDCRLLWTYSSLKVTEVASIAPDDDLILIIVNTPVYGGSGSSSYAVSFRGYATGGDTGKEVMLHEIGHTFGRLADEYTSGTCNNSIEPSELNVTRATTRSGITAVGKWGEWINPATPVPTSGTTPDVPGAYEGAKYCTTGLYRPTYNSKMRSLGNPFDTVNYGLLVKRIFDYIGADGTPPSASVTIGGSCGQPCPGTSVTLNISASDLQSYPMGYRVSNSVSFSDSQWLLTHSGSSFSKSVAHTLLSGTGDKTVYLQVMNGYGLITNTSCTCTTPVPVITSINPASTSEGGMVIINGSNFGATQGTSYVKFYNDKTASIVSWSDTQIKCTVPTGAATGNVTVTTVGGTSNGASFTMGYPESPHNYPDNADFTCTYTLAGSPSAIAVTFDALTQVESGYDKIYVMDGSGVNITGSPFTGTELAGQTKQISGATVKIRLTSNGSVNYYGFKVTNVSVGDTTPPSYPIDLTASPSGWTNTSFSINWTNPSDPSGIVGAYYKLGSAPTSNSDYTGYTTDKPFTVWATQEGGQTIYVWLKDGVGNVSYLNRAWITLNYDATAPPAPSSLGASPTGWTNTNSFSISRTNPYDISEIAGAYYKLGSPPSSNSDYSGYTTNNPFSVSATAQGGQTIYVWLQDGAGNKNYQNRNSTTLYYDGTAPSNPTSATELGGAPNNTWQKTVSDPNFTWIGASDSGGSGLAGYYYYWGTDPAGTSTNYTANSGYDPSSVGDGTYYLRVRTKDNAGNLSSWSTIFTFKYDGTAPNVPSSLTSLTHPQNFPTSNNSPVFNWTASADTGGSGIAGYSYAVTLTENYALDTTTETISTTVNLSKKEDGIYWFHVRGVDNAGNGSTIVRYKFIVDTTSPTYITSYARNPANAGDLLLTVNAGEILKATPTVTVTQNGGSLVSVPMTSSDNIVWTGTYTVVVNYDGTAAVNITGTDLADNIGTGSSSFQVDTINPSATIILSPSGVLKTGPFTVNLTITDASPINGTPVLSYIPSGQSAIPVALTGSDKTWTGRGYIESTISTGTAVFSFSAQDLAGNIGTSITAGSSFIIDTSINGIAGGTVTNSDGASVIVKPGTYSSGSLVITIGIPDENRSDIVEGNKNTSKGSPVPGNNLYREYFAYDSVTGALIKTFSPPLTLIVFYPDANNDGLVDGTNIRERRLKLFWLNPAVKKWEEVSSAVQDYSMNKFTAQVSHFSVYTILNVSPESVVYPVPWKPGSGGKFDSAADACGTGIIFDWLPLEAEIRIYNYQGDLIRELKLTASDNGCKAWDGKNAAGRDVASGIYLAVIKTPTGSKIVKKLAIER